MFKSAFKELINEDYSIGVDIEIFQGVLDHALSKVDFSVVIVIYMLSSNLNWNIEKTKGYNNEISVSNTGMKIGWNRQINRNFRKLPVVKPDVPKTVISVALHDPLRVTMSQNLKIFTEKHNDEKLAMKILIVGAGLIGYHFR